MDDARPEPDPDPSAPDLILPLGLLLGTADGTADIRCGVTVHRLPPEQYLVWGLAHGSAGALRTGRAWTRAEVLGLAEATGLDDAAPAIEALGGAGLLVETPGTGPAARRFATAHRVLPLLTGQGNTAENPELFGIGVGGEALLQVGFTEYDLWQFAAMDDTLWDACRSAAAARTSGPGRADDLTDDDLAGDDPADDPDPGDPDAVAELLLARFLTALPALLLTGAAYLDVTFRLAHPAPARRDRDAA